MRLQPLRQASPVPKLPDIETLAPRAIELCREAADGVEFETFLVGIRGTKSLRHLSPEDAKAWKYSLRHRVGREVAEGWEHQGRRPDFTKPQLLLVYDVDRRQVERSLRPVYVYGRYRKLERGLPQTQARWRCRGCGGDGCATCEDTGLRYPTSVEDLLGRPVAEAFDAEDGVQLHGMGREDIDVLCLGRGRPFVLEVRRPLRRTVALRALAERVQSAAAGRAELAGALRMAPEETVARVKNHVANKRYRLVCAAESPLEAASVAALEGQLSGTVLSQLTPNRVAGRRANKVRERRIVSFTTAPPDGKTFCAEVESQSGTYIKELVSGDEGRTQPSVASLLGIPCVCAQLDVLEVCVDDDEVFPPNPP